MSYILNNIIIYNKVFFFPSPMAFYHVRTSNIKAIQESAAAALYQGTVLTPGEKQRKTSDTSIVLCKAYLSFFFSFFIYMLSKQ